MLLRKQKLKHWDTTTYLLQWPKPGTLTTPNAHEDVEQLSFIVDNNAKLGQLPFCFYLFTFIKFFGVATFKDNLAVSYKTKTVLTYSPSILLLGNEWLNSFKAYVHTKQAHAWL